MAEIVNISYIGAGNETQTYSQKDDALITNNTIYSKFGDPNDYIEYFIYDLNNQLIDYNYDANNYYPGRGASNPVTQQYGTINLDPQSDLKSRGYDRGSLNIQYNFHRNLFNSSYGRFFWIKEISPSRTEIKLASQNISNTDILNGYTQYQAYAAGLNYYNDFYLNFGNNELLIAVNVAYTEDADGSYILIKLYEPLPADHDVKDQLWIVEKLAEPATYNVDVQVEAVDVVQQNRLKGPNFNVKVNQTVNQTTPYYSHDSLFSTSVSSSYQKMISYYQDKSISINVDYSDFSNFIHFSSATSRINNFVYKLKSIETYNTQILASLALQGGISNPSVSASVILLQNSISDLITNFDGYEYYLYYSSGSSAWPKSNSKQPYTLYSVTSSQALNWLGSSTTVPTLSTYSILYSASYYDATNKDLLTNSIPQYLQDDSTNEPYVTFVNMVAQHFDNIWIYYKDVTNRFNATNNPNTGVSPDVVADAIIGLGTTLYTNTNVSDNLYYSLFGINQDGSLLPPTGSEKITTYVTSSIATESANDVQKEIYKRIYHNIPYLYKTKGTRASIQALINIFGIPKSVLTINEFGGYNRYSKDGVFEINNNKITGSLSVPMLSGSGNLLHPDVTIQYYQNDNRLNSRNLEVGFSPADEINSVVTSSLGLFNIDQYIGDPSYQYSGSYPALDQVKRNFFSGYSYYHNVYEYIRILKYYNNSLFKMVQDFVPARADLSTGLIVKSHLLERNKYQRHEPAVDMSMNFSESIDLIKVSGADPGEIPFSTANNTYSQFTLIPLSNPTGSAPVYGPVPISNTYSWEKYTGEFGGSEIQADYHNFDQTEYTSITSPWTSSVAGGCQLIKIQNSNLIGQNITANFTLCDGTPSSSYIAGGADSSTPNICMRTGAPITITPTYGLTYIFRNGDCTPPKMYVGQDQGALYNNVTSSVTSKLVTEAEYSYGINTPVNFDNIKTQNSCQNCNRVYCSQYVISNPDSINHVFSYQNCDNNTVVIGIPASGSTIVCAKPGTLNSYDTPAYRGFTFSSGSICGTQFSNYSYPSDCKVVSVSNLGTTNILAAYLDCAGNFQSKTISSGTSAGLSCVQLSSVSLRSISLAPFTASIIDGGYCSPYYSPYEYCQNTNFTASSAFTLGYTTCAGYRVSQAVTSGTRLNLGCIQVGSIIGGTFTTSSLGPCNNLSSYTKYCDYFLGANSSWGLGNGPVTASFIDCGGTPRTISQYSAGTPFIYITQCIRSGSLVLTNLYSPTILTGSIGYCGYYEDPTPYTGSRLLAEVQDYNYNRTSTVNSKYAGAKSTSNTYNVFTKGDKSYGTSPAMDYYVDYTGLFTSVESSSYFPDQMVAKMSYMADLSGGLQELNLQNNNWVYFQNMYKPGDTVTIKQFNATQYSNQKYLDRGLTVVESGYSYPPYWYRQSGSLECYIVEDGAVDSFATTASFAQIFASTFGPTTTIIDEIKYTPSYDPDSTYPYMYPTIPSGSFSGVSNYNWYNVSLAFSSSWSSKNDPYSIITNFSSGSRYNYISGSYFTIPRDGVYNISSVFGFAYYITPPGTTGVNSIKLDIIKWNGSSTTYGFVEGTSIYNSGINQWNIPSGTTVGGLTISLNSQANNVFLSAGDKVSVKITAYLNFSEISLYGRGHTETYQAIPSNGSLCIDTTSTNHALFNTGSYIRGGNTLTLSSGMSQYFNSLTTYNPGYESNPSPLYPRFGDVNYPTEIDPGDYVILYYSGSDVGYSSDTIYPISRRITGVNYDYSGSVTSSVASFTVYPNMPGFISGSNINNYQKAVFVKRVSDETVLTLQGKKRPGQTSYGFVVPENLNPNIAKNINTLQSTIQSQILNY